MTLEETISKTREVKVTASQLDRALRFANYTSSPTMEQVLVGATIVAYLEACPERSKAGTFLAGLVDSDLHP